jgi:DNA polymerase-3 subunit epsilon
LRRCSTRLTAGHTPPLDATPCGAAQLGVAMCPCAGQADPAVYAAAVGVARRALAGDPAAAVAPLTVKMTDLAAQQRFEEAALVRDRIAALTAAALRHQLTDALRRAGSIELRRGATTWVIDAARLVDVAIRGEVGRALPVAPPEPPVADRPLGREHVDEALCLARFCDKQAPRLEVVSLTGEWLFPLASPAGG